MRYTSILIVLMVSLTAIASSQSANGKISKIDITNIVMEMKKKSTTVESVAKILGEIQKQDQDIDGYRVLPKDPGIKEIIISMRTEEDHHSLKDTPYTVEIYLDTRYKSSIKTLFPGCYQWEPMRPTFDDFSNIWVYKCNPHGYIKNTFVRVIATYTEERSNPSTKIKKIEIFREALDAPVDFGASSGKKSVSTSAKR